MRERVERFIVENSLINRGERVLVGLSGGGDSVTLMHILNSLSRKLGFSLCAANTVMKMSGAQAEAQLS